MPEPTFVSICGSRTYERLALGMIESEDVAYGCWLPIEHDGPHWAILRVGGGFEPRAWMSEQERQSAAPDDV